ncbi:MAG: ABC transporter permease subunit [Gemmatales bacterium]
MASSASIVMQPSRWLPLWSILEMDLKQTVKSWLYRIAILVVVVVSVGVLLNRAAIHREAGVVQYASMHVGNFLQYTILFGAALSALFTASAIAGERGNLIDSTLCRGVGRWHFYIGKWMARTVAVLGGFLAVGLIFMVASVFILKSDLDFDHCLVALLLVSSILWLMVSVTMAVSATANNTMLSLGVVLFVLYGILAVLWLVPLESFTLTKFLNTMTIMIRTDDVNISQGTIRGPLPMMPYLKFAGYIALSGCAVAGVGMLHFMRKDV